MGLPARPAPGAATNGFCLGCGHIWEIQTSNGRQKYFAKLILLAHDEILINGFLQVKRGTLQMRIAVSRERIAQRARELLAHTYGPNLDRFTFSRLRLQKVAVILLSTKNMYKRVPLYYLVQSLYIESF